MKLKGLLFILPLLIVLLTGGTASGQCVSGDGNDTQVDATPMGYHQSVTGWVCPDDTFDYYVLEIPAGAEVSGKISFSSPQASTVLRIEHADTGARLINDAFTTDNKHDFEVAVAKGKLAAGTYYARIFFWSSADYEHEYKFTLNLNITGSNCFPDANEDHENAYEVMFDNSVGDYLCEFDHLDIWHFAVRTEQEAKGNIQLDANPGELQIYLYDALKTKLYQDKTTGGAVKYNLASSAGPLPYGDYYIGVFLPNNRTDENSYSLSLQPYAPQANVVEMVQPDGTGTVKDYGIGKITPGMLEMAMRPPVFARIVADSLYCIEESDVDAGSNSDEPYVLFTGVKSYANPKAWSPSGPQIFGDVDDGEINRLSRQRVVFEGEVPVDAFIGFSATIMEEDDGYVDSGVEQAYTDFILGMVDVADEVLASAAAAGTLITGSVVQGGVGAAGLGVAGGLVGLAASGVALAVVAFGGGDDDYVGTSSAYITYDDLNYWKGANPRLFEMDIDGGDEGHYKIRWHIEFDEDASSIFDAPFNEWDQIHTGNFLGGPEDEILMVSEDAGPGDDGRFRVYDSAGNVLYRWYKFYTTYDQVAVGDVTGNGFDDVVVSSDDNDGVIAIYSPHGEHINMFYAPVTHYDGLAVADVNSDGKAEILLARDDDQKIYTYDATGAQMWTMPIKNWEFNGVRNTSDSTRHDAFLVGDVMGNSSPEIILIDLKDGPNSVIHIYPGDSTDGTELRPPIRFDFFGGTFTGFDAPCLADLNGDGKMELIVATDQGDGGWGCKVKVYDLVKNEMSTERYWPMFTHYDGFTSGDVLGSGRDQLLLATDEDDKVYISK